VPRAGTRCWRPLSWSRWEPARPSKLASSRSTTVRLLGQVDADRRRRIVGRERGQRACSRSAGSVTVSSPIFAQLLRKMSAKLGAMIASKPYCCRPHGACSREEPAAEVRPGDEHVGAGVALVVQDEVRVLPPVVEHELAEAGALDPLEVLLGHDLVGVDVGPVQRHHPALMTVTGSMTRSPLHPGSSRTSTKWPWTAAAAAICGLTRCVRPPLPWRPSKLRFDVDAQRSPGSEDVRVHAEAHRAARLAPLEAGVLEDLSRPSASACSFTGTGARHDHRPDARRRPCGLRPPSRRRRSSMRPFVQEPMNTRSTGCR
jgi:hypothetical protein